MPVDEARAETGLYEAATAFRDRALLSDDSLFTPDRPIWTTEALDDFHQRYVVHADTGDESFDKKLEGQLEGADDATIQLAAELLYAHFLSPGGMSAGAKVDHVEGVLGLMTEPVSISDDLRKALTGGVANFGAAHSHRYHLVRFLLQFVRSVKDLPEEERNEILQDPWRLKDFVLDLDLHGARSQVEALFHLLHPGAFEPIVSHGAKTAIARTWEDLVEDPEDDLDRRILQIRERLYDQYGEGYSFYEPRIRAVWESKEKPWDEFTDWARRFYEAETFEETERDYKLDVARDLRDVQELIDEGGEWLDDLDSALQTNLMRWSREDFISWCRQDETRAAEALSNLWTNDNPLVDRIDQFERTAIAPASVTKVRVTSVLLMALDPTEYPPYAKSAFDKAFELSGHPAPRDDATPGERYRHALAFLDRFLDQAEERGLELRDRLDAQGLVWQITKADDDGALVAEWDEDTWREFLAYRGDIEPPPNGDGPDRDPLAELADELLLERGFLARIKRLLRAKGQAIFYGPPGTGKTYVAQKLAETLTEDGGETRLVQFHPSYAYEDFVEGYRPSVDAGASGFAPVEGPLKKIANTARNSPNDPHVLIIDEINRGNIAKVFGELYFLLEYRDQAIDLQYSGEGFRLPENLWIIGTMNTADRSIALMDAALRRRFYFVPFFPQEPPIEGLLGRWLDAHADDGLRWVADVVREANDRLDDPHFAIGPSYFLREDLTEEWVETVWKHSVLPYLEERFFGEQEALARFRLDELRSAVEGTAKPAPEDAGAEGTADAEAGPNE